MRRHCAPRLLRALCRAGCVWGGCVPKPVARVRIAERRAGSAERAERAAGTRKRRRCFSLSSLQQRSGTHRFAAPPSRIWTAPQWRPLVSSTGPGDPTVSSGNAAGAGPSRLRPRLFPSESLPALPLRAQPHRVGGLVGRWRPRGGPRVLWSPPPGACLPSLAGALLADAGLLPAAWLFTRSCTGGRRAPVAEVAAQAAAGSPGRFRARDRALAPQSAQGACGLSRPVATARGGLVSL